MAPIDSIPPEVISHIVGLVGAPQSGLLSLALVARVWRFPAQEQLALDVEVQTEAGGKAFVDGFPRTKADGTSRRVRSLTLKRALKESGEFDERHGTTLSQMTAVAVLNVARPTELLHLDWFVGLYMQILRLPSVQEERSLHVEEQAFGRDEGDYPDETLNYGTGQVSLRLRHLQMYVDYEEEHKWLLPLEFVRDVVIGSGRDLVSLDLTGYAAGNHRGPEGDVASIIFDHLAPQLVTLTLSPPWNGNRGREPKLPRDVARILSVLPASLLFLELRPPYDDEHSEWLKSAFASDYVDANPPPFLAFLELPCFQNLKRWRIHGLSNVDMSSGVGAEWKATCDERGIELREGSDLFVTDIPLVSTNLALHVCSLSRERIVNS